MVGVKVVMVVVNTFIVVMKMVMVTFRDRDEVMSAVVCEWFSV